MRLSPLDIRKQDFDTSLRGYSKEDVDAFLQMVSEQWEEVRDEERRLEDQVRTLKNKMQHYEQVEEALQEALQTARENSEQKLENAQQKAALMVQEAEARADEIKREAREDREVLRRQVDHLQKQRDEGVARLRAFLLSEMELLLRFDGEDPEALHEALPDQLAKHLSGASTGAENTGASGEASSVSNRESAPAQREPAQPRDLDAPEARAPQQEENPAPSSDSAFDLPVSQDLSEQAEASKEKQKEEVQRPQRTEVVSPPPELGEEQDENASVESAYTEEEAYGSEDDDPGELADFLEQFETEQALEEEETDAPDAGAPDEAAGSPQEEPPQEESPANRVSLNDIFASEESEREAAPGAGVPAEDDMTATSDEIEKIRRILNDMD